MNITFFRYKKSFAKYFRSCMLLSWEIYASMRTLRINLECRSENLKTHSKLFHGISENVWIQFPDYLWKQLSEFSNGSGRTVNFFNFLKNCSKFTLDMIKSSLEATSFPDNLHQHLYYRIYYFIFCCSIKLIRLYALSVEFLVHFGDAQLCCRH